MDPLCVESQKWWIADVLPSKCLVRGKLSAAAVWSTKLTRFAWQMISGGCVAFKFDQICVETDHRRLRCVPISILIAWTCQQKLRCGGRSGLRKWSVCVGNDPLVRKADFVQTRYMPNWTNSTAKWATNAAFTANKHQTAPPQKNWSENWDENERNLVNDVKFRFDDEFCTILSANMIIEQPNAHFSANIRLEFAIFGGICLLWRDGGSIIIVFCVF